MDDKDTQVEQKAIQDSLKDGAKKAEKIGRTALDIGMIVADVLAQNWASAIMRSLKYLGKILLVILIIVVILGMFTY